MRFYTIRYSSTTVTTTILLFLLSTFVSNRFVSAVVQSNNNNNNNNNDNNNNNNDNNKNNHRTIEFINQSGERLAIEWIDPQTGNLIPMTTTTTTTTNNNNTNNHNNNCNNHIENGERISLDTFVNHTFAIHYETSSSSLSSSSSSSSLSANEMACSSSSSSILTEKNHEAKQDGREPKKCHWNNTNHSHFPTLVTVHQEKDNQIAVVKRGLKVVYQEQVQESNENDIDNDKEEKKEEEDDENIKTTTTAANTMTASPPTINHQVDIVLQTCKQRAYEEYLKIGRYNSYHARDGDGNNVIMEKLRMCLKEQSSRLLQVKQEEILFESELRTAIASKLENHTCAETNKPTSEPIEIRKWTTTETTKTNQQDNTRNEHENIRNDNDNDTTATTTTMTTRNVLIMHNRPSSQIHVIENFISIDECQTIQNRAASKLHRGSVANGKGGHQFSEHRKAWQARLLIPWKNETDPIANVMRRMYQYANDAVVEYNLTYDGQEDMMSIQYFGMENNNNNNNNDNENKNKKKTDFSQYNNKTNINNNINNNNNEPPDQYRPHCDGDCDGKIHKMGGRVATMVMYCTVPDVDDDGGGGGGGGGGGATNFQNANIYIRPKVGSAVFFSYMNPHTMEKDLGFTTHSGCPVLKGIKRIAVHWMRLGVSKDRPWYSFNTLTIPKEEQEEYL